MVSTTRAGDRRRGARPSPSRSGPYPPAGPYERIAPRRARARPARSRRARVEALGRGTRRGRTRSGPCASLPRAVPAARLLPSPPGTAPAAPVGSLRSTPCVTGSGQVRIRDRQAERKEHMTHNVRRARRERGDRRTRSPSAASPALSRSRRASSRDALAGRDVLAKSPTGSGKTLAFAHPDRRAPRRRGDARPARARARPDARARARRSPTSSSSLGAATRPRGRGRLRRRRRSQAQAKRARERAHPRRDARPARGPRSSAGSSRSTRPDPRPRRGRPDARHGLQAAGRPHRPAAAARPPDDVLLRDARRRGRRARPRVHERPRRASRPSCPTERRAGEIEHRFVPVTHDTQGRDARRAARGERGLALVFVRTKRGADRLVKQARAATTSTRSRCTAT